MPDRDVVQRRLRVIEESLDALSQVGDVNARRLQDEPITRAAVERLLTRIVDQAVDINSHLAVSRLGRAPATYREAFALASSAGVIEPELSEELMRSVAMRNIIVHSYVEIDLTLVSRAVPLALSHYRSYVSSVASYLLATADADADDGDHENT